MKLQIKNDPTSLLSNPAALAYIAEKLSQNPQALQELLFFLASNGVNLQALMAGDSSVLNAPGLVDKFTAYIQTKPELRAFVLEILNHFGISVPRIDWGSIGQSILDAVPTVIQTLPTIISVISLFGKRDVSSNLLTSLIQLASQYGISLSTILSAIQAIQNGNFSSLLNLIPANLIQNVLSGLNIQQLLANIDLSQVLSLVQSRKLFNKH